MVLHLCPNSSDAVKRLVYSTFLTLLLKSHILYLIQPKTCDKDVFQSIYCITCTAQWGKYDGA